MRTAPGRENEGGMAMAAESMQHERSISALEASYQRLATKADVELAKTVKAWERKVEIAEV